MTVPAGGGACPGATAGRVRTRTAGAALARAWRGVRWYLRELSGEARWDDYLAHCRAHGHEPMSRAQFERDRADEAEKAAVNRCC